MRMHIVQKVYQFKYIIAKMLRDSGLYKEAMECLDLCIKINPYSWFAK